jgi:hypothetical protein
MADGDAPTAAAGAAAVSPELTAQAAHAAMPTLAAAGASATPVAADTGKSGPAEPAAPDTPPRLETSRMRGRTSPQAQQQGLGPFAAPPLPDIEDSLARSCVPTAAATTVQAASSAVSPQPASQHDQQGEPPAARPAAMPLAARDAAVQRILSAGDSPLTEGPAAAPAAERLDWCAMHTFQSSRTGGCYLSIRHLIGPYMGTSPHAKTLGTLHAGHLLCWVWSARLCRHQPVHRWKGHSSQPLHAPLCSCRRSRQSCGRHTGSRAWPCTLTSAVTRWPARYPSPDFRSPI